LKLKTTIRLWNSVRRLDTDYERMLYRQRPQRTPSWQKNPTVGSLMTFEEA
jgi:hypothetical protein